MKPITTLIHAKYLLPVEPMDILENHSLAIKNDTIIDLLPTQEALKLYEATETINLDHHILCPGFINMHTHSPMALLRGLADDLKLMDWLHNHIWPAETAIMSEEYIQDGTMLACAEMIKSGTTCFNEHYFYPDIIANTAHEIGIRARIGVLIINVPTKWAKDEEDGIKQALKLLDSQASTDMLSISLAPHSPYATSEEALKRIAKIAEERKLSIHIHMHESTDEINISLQKFNCRPLQHMQKINLLSPRTQLVHMTQTTEEDIRIIREMGSHVIHCPESNLKLASGQCPVQLFLNNKINVCLGTDGAASNNDLDMIGEMRSAAFIGKMIANDSTAISAENALRMATINGANALGLSHLIGSLSIGKKADLTAVDINHLNTQPLYNPISQLVYACQSQQVSDVWVAGKRLLKNGQLTTLNEHAILTNTQSWQVKLRKYAHGISQNSKNR